MDDAFGDPLALVNQFEMQDFIEDPSFSDFIDLIRGETDDSLAGFEADLCNDKQQMVSSAAAVDVFDCKETSNGFSDAINYGFLNVLPSFTGEMKGREDHNDEEKSTGIATMTMTTTTTKNTKVDRSRTLICERRRRGRMKEKLYALRALVPNITKMDKASIIGDAVLYVQELQMQANKLKAEIAGLEASLEGPKYRKEIYKPKTIASSDHKYPVCKKIMQMDMFQVEERGFYIRLMCSKGEGVAASLYKALETLVGFTIQNSNLVTVSDRFTLTLTLNVVEFEKAVNLPNLKLWVSAALLNQGFQL